MLRHVNIYNMFMGTCQEHWASTSPTQGKEVLLAEQCPLPGSAESHRAHRAVRFLDHLLQPGHMAPNVSRSFGLEKTTKTIKNKHYSEIFVIHVIKVL